MADDYSESGLLIQIKELLQGMGASITINVAEGDLAPLGAVDDAAYSDATGAADGTMIALLKGCYVQLAVIAANTEPA